MNIFSKKWIGKKIRSILLYLLHLLSFGKPQASLVKKTQWWKFPLQITIAILKWWSISSMFTSQKALLQWEIYGKLWVIYQDPKNVYKKIVYPKNYIKNFEFKSFTKFGAVGPRTEIYKAYHPSLTLQEE